MLTPDPMGGRSEGANSRLDVCDFEIAPDIRASTLRVGREAHSVVVLDGVLRTPRSIVDFAATQGRFSRSISDANYYPGVRAPAPQAYVARVYEAVRPYMTDVFGFPTSGAIKADFYLSIATLPPERLNVWQRGAHFDTVDRDQLAVLHYLCDPAYGGTAFYRHRETGYEAMTQERLPGYLEALQRDLDRNGPPPAAYLTASDRRFEQIASIDAVFNRVVIYRGQMLHAGSVNAHAGLSADPRRGRLTANAFFYLSTGARA
jgi:Family of unknown function (DUF6445)